MINAGGKGWAVMSGGDHGSAWCTKMFNFTVLELSLLWKYLNVLFLNVFMNIVSVL